MWKLDIQEHVAWAYNLKLWVCDSLYKMFCSYIDWIINLLSKKGRMSDYEIVMKSVNKEYIIVNMGKYFKDILSEDVQKVLKDPNSRYSGRYELLKKHSVQELWKNRLEQIKSRYSCKHEYWKEQLEQVKPKIIKNEISNFKTSFSEQLNENEVYKAYKELLTFKKNLKSWKVEIDNNLESLFKASTEDFKIALENLLWTNYINGKEHDEIQELLKDFKDITPKDSEYLLMLENQSNFYKALDYLFDKNQTTLSCDEAVNAIKAIQLPSGLSQQLATNLSGKVLPRIEKLLGEEKYVELYKFCVVYRFIELKFKFQPKYCKVLDFLKKNRQQEETMWIYWHVLQVKDDSNLKLLIDQSNSLSNPKIDLLESLHNSNEAKNNKNLSDVLNTWLIDNSKKDDLTKKVADAMDLIKKNMDDKVKALADNLNYYDTLSTINLTSVRNLIEQCRLRHISIPLPKKIENLDSLANTMKTWELNLKDRKEWLDKFKKREKNVKKSTEYESGINILQYLLYYLECVLRNSKFKHDDEFKFWNIGDNKEPLVTSDDLSQGKLGDCWFISSLNKLVLNKEKLNFFPNAKAEISEEGMVISDSVTVRLYKVNLEKKEKKKKKKNKKNKKNKSNNNNIISVTAKLEKPIYMTIKKDTVLTMRRAEFGNRSPVLWPNFLEQAMTAARQQENMVTGSGDVDDLIKTWSKKRKGIQALRGGFTDGVAYCMLTGKTQEILESQSTDKEDLHLGYTTDEMNIFRYIQKKLKDKEYLNVGIAKKKTWLDKCSKDLDDVTTFALQKRNPKNIRDRILEIEKGPNYMYRLPGDHAYTIVGTKIDNGYYVVLKNPWNNPTVKGGGNIEVPLKVFCKWFKGKIG